MYRLLAVLVGWTLVSTGFCYGADDDFVDCLQVIPERERLTCYDGFARAALSRGTAEADDRSAPVVAEPRVVAAAPALAAALIPEPTLESPAPRRSSRSTSFQTAAISSRLATALFGGRSRAALSADTRSERK